MPDAPDNRKELLRIYLAGDIGGKAVPVFVVEYAAFVQFCANKELAQTVYDVFQRADRVAPVVVVQQRVNELLLQDHLTPVAQQVLKQLYDFAVSGLRRYDDVFAASDLKPSEHFYLKDWYIRQAERPLVQFDIKLYHK